MQHAGNSIAYALLAAALLFTSANASGASVVANVTVICPLGVVLNMQPGYARLGNITFNYTLHTIAECNATGVTGRILISNYTTGNVVNARSLQIGNVNQAVVRRYLQLNTTSLLQGKYKANLTVFGYATRNSSFATFSLFNPANVVITAFSAISTTLGAPETFYVQLFNNGSFSSSNVLLEINISGPANYRLQYDEPPLGPYQKVNITATLYNITSVVGTYVASATALYIVNGVQEASKTISAAYSVTAPAAPSPPPPKKVTKPIVPLPQLALTYVPYYTAITTGTSTLSQLSFKDTANAPEFVNISIASAYASLVSLSANSLLIQPGGAASVQLLFLPQPASRAGSYVIPINVSATIANRTTTQTEYISLTVSSYRHENQTVNSQVALTNYTNTASATLQISNPTNHTITNETLETLLPLSITSSISKITAYGLPNNVSVENGYYSIKWFVSSLPKGQTVYAYYSIANISSPIQLATMQTTLRMPTLVAPQNILKILNIEAPQAFTNSTAHLTIGSLYAGTSAQQVLFMLTSPSGITIANPVQTVNATPNQFITTSFRIMTGGIAGTYMLNFYASTPGANLSYTIPMIVLQAPTTTATTTIQPAPARRIAISETFIVSILTFIGILLIVVALALARSRQNRPKYNPERAEHLKMIKDQIKRGEGIE